jgi:hypothetical protein
MSQATNAVGNGGKSTPTPNSTLGKDRLKKEMDKYVKDPINYP